MNRKTQRTAAATLLLFTGLLAACSTGQPGVTNEVGCVVTRVAANTTDATAAARKAVESLKLTSVTSQATAVDGIVTARTAQGDDVKISIDRDGDNVSKVSIRVGTWGDEATSLSIVEKMRESIK
jgi:Protein of unknown function (DUF3568)